MTVKINSYDAKHKQALKELLTPLEKSYPNFQLWLERKLTTEGVTIHLAMDKDVLVGAVIGASQNMNTYKISTLYVKPEYQHQTLGTQFMELMLEQAKRAGSREVFITSDSSLHPTLGEFLYKHGFVPLIAERNKYIPGKTEIMYYKYM